MYRPKYTISKEDLYKLYSIEGKSAVRIAKIYNCSDDTILNRLKEFKIPSTFRVKILKDDLQRLYLKENKSTIEIAKIYSCSSGTVSYKLNKFGIPRKSKCQIHMKYAKYDFRGTLAEKAYSIGFRTGDLNVYKTKKNAETIVVRCHTTQDAQINVIKIIFGNYGQISINNQKDGTIYVNCFLNTTFNFLLPKKDKIEGWIYGNKKTFCAFMAGYIDAEGNFIINQGRARFKLDSYDKNILLGMHSWLQENGIRSKIRIIGKRGQIRPEGYCFNKDLWRLNVNEAESLYNFINLIKPFILHKKRLSDIEICLENINRRKGLGTIRWR